MTSFTNARRNSSNVLTGISGGGSAVLGATAVLLASGVAAAATLPAPLVLPAVALAATVFAVIAGASASRMKGGLRSALLTAAGIFTLSAIGASILGDPDQIAIFLK